MLASLTEWHAGHCKFYAISVRQGRAARSLQSQDPAKK